MHRLHRESGEERPEPIRHIKNVNDFWAHEMSSSKQKGDLLDACSSIYSEWNDDKNWSSQDWKSDELMEVWAGRLVRGQPPGLFTEHTDKFIVDDDDMDSDTATESNCSAK